MTCTEAEPCGPRSPKLHESVLSAIAQPGTAGAIDQTMPVPVGSGSLMVTPLAVPAPVFSTEIVNPIGEPALTDALSAVLVMSRSAQRTVVVSFADTLLPLVVLAVASFAYALQLANVVALVT